MKFKMFQIDAFASKVFEGNPAAVCPLEQWLPDEIMQSIAEENNLSETAFFIKTSKGFHIRWFTPIAEVDLCGHATLATAYVIFNHMEYTSNIIEFNSKSGILSVTKNDDLLTLDFPSLEPELCDCPEAIVEAFGKKPIKCLKSMDYIAVFADEDDIVGIQPILAPLQSLDLRGVIITSVSKQYDFVVRFFAPRVGVNEDPVTGSAYTQLAPFWSKELMKTSFKAKQLSKRTGEVFCEYVQNRVKISGKVVEYMQCEIFI